MTVTEQKKEKNYLPLAFLTSAVCAVVPFWGIWGNLSGSYLGAGELEGWLWRFWWFRKLLESLWNQNPRNYGMFIMTFLNGGNYPESGNIFDLQFFSLILRPVFGAPLYYNVEVFLILLLNGLAGYALARHISGRPLLSLAACSVLILNPYVFYELANGRPRQAMLFSLPLFAVYLDRFFKSGSMKDALKAGFFLGLTGIIYLFYGLSALFFGAIFIVSKLCSGQAKRLKELFWGFSVILLVFIAIALPFSWHYTTLARSGKLPEVTYMKNVPPVEFFLSDRRTLNPDDDLANSLYRMGTGSLPADFPTAAGGEFFVPAVYIFAGIVLLIFNKKPPWLWIITLLFFYMLSLGPYLKTGLYPGIYVRTVSGGPVPLPYGFFFKYVPFVSRLFEPMRFLGMFWVALTALIGSNLIYAGEFLDSRKNAGNMVRYLATPAVVAMAVFQSFAGGALPIPSTPSHVPAFYVRMGRETEKYGIIEVPLNSQMGDYINYYQIYHNKKPLWSWAGEGALPAGFPPSDAGFYAGNDFDGENGFIKYLEQLNKMPEDPVFDDEGLLKLKKAGYRYLIVHQYGCHLHEPRRADEFYRYLLKHLTGHLGKPLLVEKERAVSGESREGGISGFYEMTVFSLEGTDGPER